MGSEDSKFRRKPNFIREEQMSCENIKKALADFPQCVNEADGARVTTHCLYPSFDNVCVYVVGYGDGFIVHDGGGALRSCWDHTDISEAEGKILRNQASIYGLKINNGHLQIEAPSIDWLMSAILAVSNASAAAAHEFLSNETATSARENNLKGQIYSILAEIFPKETIASEYTMTGTSGKAHRFDFAVHAPKDGWIVMDAISPHHVSVAAKYMAFSDIRALDGQVRGRFAIYDRQLNRDDEALIQTVADLVPVKSLSKGIERELLH